MRSGHKNSTQSLIHNSRLVSSDLVPIKKKWRLGRGMWDGGRI